MKFYTLVLGVLCSQLTFSNEYHVAKTGNDANNGTTAKSFLTIAAAVKVAYASDTITVHAGTYREWVNPIRGGESDAKRIVYRAVPGEKVEIKGSEIVTGWKKEKVGVWKVVIPNFFFKDYNPYKDSIWGDWFSSQKRIHHTGEVFLNGKSLYEKETLAKVINSVIDSTKQDQEGATYTWYCESDANNTTIWANFQKYNPNKELIEITTRKTCFYPEKPGINYITISGFIIRQAATQWAAPTAEQVGMISTHWNKGWIIENNIINDSKCNGITLGKERGTGHNVLVTGDKTKGGSVRYIEVVFNVLRNGWNKKNIGSHIVRNNTIYNCEQTGICGSMGAVFSTIENNHIYNIWTKRQFKGAEIAGIKLHGAIDVSIKQNRINNCGRGVWLDWMTQGTRLSRNLLYNNDIDDLFLEVNHGPAIVDNNILLSPLSVNNWSEGFAFLHNFIAGQIYIKPVPDRFTPYFLPHTIEIFGLSTILCGDDRYYNNIIVGIDKKTNDKYPLGLEGYNVAKQQTWADGNIYYNGAKGSKKDTNSTNASEYNPAVKLVEEGEQVYLSFMPDKTYFNQKAKLVTTKLLGKTKIAEALYDNPDGTPLTIDTDYFGNKRTEANNATGPFLDVKKGEMKIKVW